MDINKFRDTLHQLPKDEPTANQVIQHTAEYLREVPKIDKDQIVNKFQKELKGPSGSERTR